jgi:hypothetical protein
MGRRGANVATLRRVALFDLVVTLPFALPIVAQRVVYFFFDLDERLDLGTVLPRLDSIHLLFINLMGVLAVLWNVARVRARGPELAQLDVWGRCVVAAWITGYVLFSRVTPILLVFVVTELGGAWIERKALRKR